MMIKIYFHKQVIDIEKKSKIFVCLYATTFCTKCWRFLFMPVMLGSNIVKLSSCLKIWLRGSYFYFIFSTHERRICKKQSVTTMVNGTWYSMVPFQPHVTYYTKSKYPCLSLRDEPRTPDARDCLAFRRLKKRV